MRNACGEPPVNTQVPERKGPRNRRAAAVIVAGLRYVTVNVVPELLPEYPAYDAEARTP